jgi:hypothetical protein
MRRQGISLAMASLYLGWETAYTSGFSAEAVFAANKQKNIGNMYLWISLFFASTTALYSLIFLYSDEIEA